MILTIRVTKEIFGHKGLKGYPTRVLHVCLHIYIYIHTYISG